MDDICFRARLRQEFESRRRKNPRYSLRALAMFLNTDHSTLAQILRGARYGVCEFGLLAMSQ